MAKTFPDLSQNFPSPKSQNCARARLLATSIYGADPPSIYHWRPDYICLIVSAILGKEKAELGALPKMAKRVVTEITIPVRFGFASQFRCDFFC